MLSKILLSSLTLYAEEIIGENQCGFRHNRSTTDNVFCIRLILGKKLDFNFREHCWYICLSGKIFASRR